MDKLKGLIVDLLKHIDDHKEAYKKDEWTNENIVNAWFKMYDHEFKKLGLFNISVSDIDLKELFPYENIEEARPTRPEVRILKYNARQADRREGAERLINMLHSH